jgi:hypothetical protein
MVYALTNPICVTNKKKRDKILVYRVLKLCKPRSIDFFNLIISSHLKYDQEMKQEMKFRSSLYKKRRKKDAKLKEIEKFNSDYTVILKFEYNYINFTSILQN